MSAFDTPWDLVRHFDADRPIACCRPHLVRQAAKWFLTNFTGETLYAVKANPSPWVLKTLHESGIHQYDVASIPEMELVAEHCPGATMHFMHPVKSRAAIRRAYFDFGIRTFVFDCEAELDKILDTTARAKDLTLILRVGVSNQGAEMPIDGKFGAPHYDVPRLLKLVRPLSARLGLCFHPGSQCMDPFAWAVHMDTLSRYIDDSGVDVDIMDVGGGFPVSYPGKEPTALERFPIVIQDAFDRMPLARDAELWCEPGRALVAEGTSLLTHVELVRGNEIFINDGAFGTLYDAAHCKWPFPIRLIRRNGEPSVRLKAFKLFGPTCDSADVITGPFFLPEDIREGDVIEIGTLGAYGVAMQTGFNGYGETVDAFANDTPWHSVYEPRVFNVSEKSTWFSTI